jgi:hypothetical protein
MEGAEQFYRDLRARGIEVRIGMTATALSVSYESRPRVRLRRVDVDHRVALGHGIELRERRMPETFRQP